MKHLVKSSRPHYLTRAQFLDRYAPTPAQEAQIVASLRQAGFSITKRYSNRTIVDASAPSGIAERFFGTTIHDFKQQGRSIQYASVKPIVVPKRMASLIAAVTIDTVIHLHVGVEHTPPTTRQRAAPIESLDTAPSGEAADPTGNLVGNPGFETGHLAPWQGCHSGSAPFGKVTSKPHSGTHGAFTGTYTTKKPEVNGVSCIEQLVTIPKSGKLSVWVNRTTNDTSKNAGEYGALYANTAKGKLVKTLFDTQTTVGWRKITTNLSSLAGQQLWLAFGVYGSKKDLQKYVGMWIDDVSLTGTITPTPTPSPKPTPSPTPTPTTSPTSLPGCYSGSTPPPTPVPNYGGNGGWGPNSVADGVEMGSIYCYYGNGQTAAIVIDAMPASSDVAAYLQYFGITRTGSITAELVDGGDSKPSQDDLGEATLDVETIASLATGANVVVYEMPNLEYQSSIDAYNQIISDGIATVVSSSFAGCEAGSSSYNTSTNAIAQQGAAEGVTFAASSGDTGVSCQRTTPLVGVSSPASDPYFVAVGGTQSISQPAISYFDCLGPVVSIVNPVVWNCPNHNPTYSNAGGGGISAQWPQPTYQTGLTGSTGRSVPDISLPGIGVDIIQGGAWQTTGGTSWASPMYAAMQAEINEECGANFWGINALYGAFSNDPTYQYAFYDVTSGNDSYAGDTGYTAATGFDTASGIGIPLGVNIAYETQCSVSNPTVRKMHGRRPVRAIGGTSR